MAIARVQSGSATGSNKTPKVTLGSVPAQNNLLICLITAAEAAASSITSPSGFTEVDSGLAQGTLAYKLSYQIAPNLHNGSISGSIPSNANWAMVVAEYSGETTTGVFDVTTNGSNAGSVTSLALGPTSSAAQAQELAVVGMGFNGTPGTVAFTSSFGLVLTASGTISASLGDLISTSATTFSTTASWGTSRTPIGVVASFKTSVVASSQSVSGTGITSAETFGTAAVAPGTATVSPSGVASSETFGTAAMGSVLSPTGIATSQAFGTPTFGLPAVQIIPTGIASAQAFGSGTVVTGPVTISPSGIASVEAFGDTGVIPLAPSFNATATYNKADWVYDQPGVSFGGSGTGLYLFRTPGRFTIDLEGAFAWSLWTRVHRTIPVTLMQHQSGSWEEFGASPYIIEPSMKYLYGTKGFYNGDNISVDVVLRKYIGGHDYIINDALRLELNAAVTSQEPNGYAAYILPAPAGAIYTGDEIILSGHVTEFAS